MAGTVSAEDKLLLSRAYDALELAERTGSPKFLGFLNEHESLFLRQNLPKRADMSYYGGYPDAVRLMPGASADEESFPITALEFTYKSEFDLRHRDFLGSLMALGIRRDTVGDILTSPGRTVVFFSDDIVPYIISQVDKIGRVGVSVSYADTSDLPVPDDVEEMTLAISSLRLDVFTSAVTKLSRDKAARLIRSDMVMVDHIPENSVSRLIGEGATVTIRKYGKFVLSALLGDTRKGKLRVAVRHFR